MTSHRKNIILLIERGHIPEAKTETALRCAGIIPDSSAWLKFIDQWLLWLGSLAMAFSAMFFVAYNWEDIGRLTRFGLVESSLVLAVFAYCRLGPDKVAGKAALMAAAIVLGVLLALFGQTYQTGADPWQLFFNWALLLLPWALIGQLAALWVFWLLLWNLSALLYFHTFRGGFSLLFEGASEFHWWIFGLNTLALISWEYAARWLPWLRPRWAPRLLALWCILPLTWLVILAILDGMRNSTLIALVWIVWPLWLAVTYVMYCRKKPDLFMLALGCFSFLIVIDTLVARYVFNFDTAASFLALAMLTVGIGSGTAVWLRHIHKEWQHESRT